MQCLEARRIYSDAINNRTPIETLNAAVRDHLRTCPDCHRLLRGLVQLMAAPGNDCAAVRSELVGYAEAELRGEGGQPHFAEVRLHLDLCVDCASDYGLVVQSLILGAGHDLEESRKLSMQMPAADLSFLGQASEPVSIDEHTVWKRLWNTVLRWEGPRRVALSFSDELLNALSGGQQPAAAVATRAERGPRLLWSLEVPSNHGALQITVTAEEQRHNPSNVALLLAITDVERGGWPNLAGIEVECRWGQQERRQVVTDAFGKAVVDGIPAEQLASLSIVIDAGVEG